MKYRKTAKIENAVAMARYIEQRGKVTAEELAEKFDLCTRSVYRYVDKLSNFLPIYTKAGTDGGIFWRKNKETKQ